MSPVDARTYLLCGYVQPALLTAALGSADPTLATGRQLIVDRLFRQPALRRDLQRLMLRAGQANTRREREAVEVGWVTLFYGVGVHHCGSAGGAGEVLRAARDLAACLRAFLMPEPEVVPGAPLIVSPLYG